jgi:hypothetical protein
MNNYDLLLTASCYKSGANATRLINSIKYIDARCLIIVACPNIDDAQYILGQLDDNKNIGIMILRSSLDNMYLCRAFGFLAALQKDISALYYCSMDDDIEFLPESNDIVSTLNELYNKIGFSTATFHCGARSPNEDAKIVHTNPSYINGDSMFSCFEDTLDYGLPDSLPDSQITYYTEAEYQHRLRYFTKQPTVIDNTQTRYIHHYYSRTEHDRNPNSGKMMSDGELFWERKYHIPRPSFSDIRTHAIVYEQTMRPENEHLICRHLMFGGLWNDWDTIIKKYSPYYEILYRRTY